jgi:glycosyltransferase involved in cell wall biosynthesis
MVARFKEQKDQTTLLEAIAQLENKEIHLDLIGSGSLLESCQKLARSLGIAERISFCGARTDVPELLAQAQIFVLSTHYEGLPISILEAMRAGLPVVATSVNGIPELVDHGTTGFLVPRADVKALALALKTLTEFPALRQSMGEAGRQKFLQEFTVESMIASIEAVYQKILKQ